MQNPPVHIYIFKPLSGTPGKRRTSDFNYTQPTVPLIPSSMRGLTHVSPSASWHFVYPHNHSPSQRIMGQYDVILILKSPAIER